MKTIPVFVIDGILDSGKTTFIQDTIKSDDFYVKGKTLVLACEQGEVEYSDDFCNKYNTIVEYFENQDEFTSLNLAKLVEKHNPNRIVVELNGMWDISLIQFPSYFKIYQFINFINFATFPVYFNNMRQKFIDVIKQADVVVFINVFDREKLKPYSSSMKISNNQAQFFMMNEEGKLDDAFEVELPFDFNSEVIKIEDKDYGLWYIDTFDHKDRYEGKYVEFNAMVVLSNTLPKKTFIAGRLAMTCCSNDIQLYGHLAMDNAPFKLHDRTWVHILARVHYEFSEEYQEEELVLYPEKIEKINEIKDSLLDLTK